jgi:hypothetical protein
VLSEDPSLAEVIQHGIDAAVRGIFKAGPGIVKAYDPLTNTAFVRPAIKRSMYSTEGERAFYEPPEIPFVPIIFPRAGGMVLRLPVKPGDTVLLIYCDEGLAEWRDQGGVTEPQDARLHSMGWPVAIPGFFPDSQTMSPLDGAASATQAVFGEDGGNQVRVGPTGIELAPAGVTPISPVALSVPTDAGIQGAFAAITILFGIVSDLQSKYNSHTHVAPSGGGPTAVPVPLLDAPPPAPAAPATTAALKTRAL